VILLGSAGQRIITAGEILCIAGLTAGLNTTQKNEYNITVLRGPSISELILSPTEIDYTGIDSPDIVIALDQEGVNRRPDVFRSLDGRSLILLAEGVEAPPVNVPVHHMNLKSQKIKKPDWALAALSVMAKTGRIISPQMLEAALATRFKDNILASSLELVRRVETGS
jgi:Pyruvate/2-oxoacid:ferredoxin oxidoreductase gamma subunit